MIPSVAIIRYESFPAQRHRLWIPLFLLWIPLLVLAPLLLLVVLVVSLALRVNVFRILWDFLCALSGLHVHVQAKGNVVTVRII